MSNSLSLYFVGELDILLFAVKDVSSEFDMFHPLAVIVNFAQEAIIPSLGTGVVPTGPTFQRSHNLLRLVWREGLR